MNSVSCVILSILEWLDTSKAVVVVVEHKQQVSASSECLFVGFLLLLVSEIELRAIALVSANWSQLKAALSPPLNVSACVCVHLSVG